MASSVGARMSREDFRKAKELEELRKTGAAPPELDDEGKMINPHIPQYISAAPWYYKQDKPGLKHQYHSKFKKEDEIDNDINSHTKQLIVSQPTRTAYVEGACENCGSITHSVKQCLERPRKKSAKYGGVITGKDEILVENKKLSYDGKRDRWSGYDPREYQKVVDLHKLAEIERQKKKLEELEAAMKTEEQKQQQPKQTTNTTSSSSTATVTASSSSSSLSSSTVVPPPAPDVKESDLDKLKRLKQAKKLSKLRKKIALATSAKNAAAAEGGETQTNTDTIRKDGSDSDTDSDTDSDIGSDEDVKDYGEVITKMDAKSRTTVRNLRIREDTAKYLRNLAPDSAHYDPKTRSMRENPYPDKRPDEVLYAGDNFVRSSGDVNEIAKLQRYVWDQNEKQALKAELGITAEEDEAKQAAAALLSSNDDAVLNAEIHAVALPSAAEKLYQSHKAKRELNAAHTKNSILHKYGGEEHLIRPSADLLLNVNENYVEYDEAGHVIKGQEKATRRSKYLEDVYEDGHTAVWGSYMSADKKWGYACCHQTIRHCVCVGEAGKQLKAELERDMNNRQALQGTQAAAMTITGEKRPREETSTQQQSSSYSFKNQQDYNRGGLYSIPTESDLESYHRNRQHREDPMNRMKDAV